MDTRILYLIEAHFLTVLLVLLTVVVLSRVLRRQRRPGATMAWILAIVLVPYLGIPGYVLFGSRKVRAVRSEKHRLHQTRMDRATRLLEFDHEAEDVLTSNGVRPPTRCNRVEFIADGVQAYERILREIEGAERSIYLQTYAFLADEVSARVRDALARKAAQGVDVRLLIDSYGSIRTSSAFLRPLRDAGGCVARFMPLLPVSRHWSINLRNHRKTFIIDGRIASVGGMNFGKPYMGPDPDPVRWIDTVVILEGPAVSDVLEVFASDWNFASGDLINMAHAGRAMAPETDGDDIVQVVASGPDVQRDPLYEGVLASIHAARERIWMVTPYFAPGDELFRALLMQARIGRDVRLLMPAKSNHVTADLVRGPYLRQLAREGGKVLLYDAPMIHAKNIVFDERTAVTGTMNFDLRSLDVNFEVAMFAYNRARIREIAAWMEGYMARATRYEPVTPSGARLMLEQVMFLFTPLL